ncbi:GNAT family N-acetyltransferase [Oceanobacillus bengalensis]|uniref:N-acetyltransferase n=1 Tax=Oceanobacillus bengalensis TaxID=1435466 RepID=A0A494Z465_9BACI|nr:GNAT family N-acetyltransferase [Oceanobacillus bengalensis]RKQ17103.1 N-acetyltransferase [Oceanobacillus bengalensis]
MSWYEKLKTYFPVSEMKSKEQLETLLTEKGELYVKNEGEYHIVLYADFSSFLFVDFLLVSRESRGKGIGHQVMEKLKAKNKPIILEVEPINKEDQDTEKRLRFYKREGFKHALPIMYQFQSLVVNEETEMEILYWADDEINEMMIYENMKKVYNQIHAYKAEELYGYPPKQVSEVIRFEKNRE